MNEQSPFRVPEGRPRPAPGFNPGIPWGLALLLALPAAASDVPGVRFLAAGDRRVRLEVGGAALSPAAAPEEVCLAWAWDERGPAVEIYPGDEAGTFAAAEKTWTLRADGTSTSPPNPPGGLQQPCPAATPFPELGLGPADELWFLRSPDDPAAASAWADLVHAVEAAYRQSSPFGEPPLSAMTVGAYGRCEVRSVPVGLRTRLDRWLPVELPAADPAAVVRVRRFLWWVEPAPGALGCVSAGTGTLRLFPFPAGAPETKTEAVAEEYLLTVEGAVSKRLSRLDLDPEDRSPRVRAAVAVERQPETAPDPPAEEPDRGAYLGPALAAAAAALSLAAFLRSRPRWTEPELVRLIEATVDRRLRASREPEARAAELRADLEVPAEPAGPGPAPGAAAADPEAVAAPDPEDGAGEEALPDDLCRLGEGERRRLADGLEAMSQLGLWIELLWPVLREASGSDLDAISFSLPEPAAAEWSRARAVLEEFSLRDAAAARRILRGLAAGNGREPFDAATAGFLAGAGLSDPGLPFPERLKRYLEPFDHTGRLGQVTLALQYLVEAYPIEQLDPARRALLRRGMAEAAGSVRLASDFHDLIARIAAGVGLDYRAVAYYRSRLDQREYAFVRGQVSPISLTERVGFAAATDPVVVVRLERPFFFQSANHVYYAGHAHVARG